MKRKAAAKTGISAGGGFSLNGSRAGTSHATTSVKTGRYARNNYYKTRVCFNGAEGIQCERVWDGKKMVGGPGSISMGSGESISQEEYISRKRYNWGTGCKDLIFRASNVGDHVSIVLGSDGNYQVSFGGKTHNVHWNNDILGVSGFMNNDNNFTVTTVKINGNYKVTMTNGVGNILSFKNPVITDYGVICINDKIVEVNKSAPIGPSNYDGVGGYMDKVKQPFIDPSFCT